MPSPELLLVAGVFLLAGAVKGVVGLGLPTVGVALLTATLGLREAMVLILLPSLVTNLWQAVVGGALGALLRRFWPLLAGGALATWLAAGLLARADAALLAGLLGLLLVLYAAHGLARPALPPPGRREPWLSPLVGAASGLLTGLTGTFVLPAVPYLQALGLPRDLLVQAMGLWFSVATLALGVALGGHGLLPAELGLLSLAGLPTALLGMALGQRLRKRLPEARFRQALLVALALLGGHLMLRAWG